MTKKKLVYRGIIVSPFEKDTEEEALKVLNAIRMCHPEMDGWVELNAYIEKLPNGKYRAIRVHEKYEIEVFTPYNICC